MSDIKKLSTQPGIDPGFKHLQTLCLYHKTISPPDALTAFLFYFTVSRFGWN
jgi:hypothetical protein